MRIFKQIIIIILIIVFVISLDFITNNITKSSIKKVKDNMKILEDHIESNSEEMKKEAEELKEDWKNLENKLSFYLEHNELEKISVKMNLLKKQVEIGELEDARESITEINYSLEHVEEKQKLKIKNIF